MSKSTLEAARERDRTGRLRTILGGRRTQIHKLPVPQNKGSRIECCANPRHRKYIERMEREAPQDLYWRTYRNRAGSFWEIAEKHVFWQLLQEPCFLCGVQPALGLDRTDYKGRYTLNNVQPCCSLCNMLKHRHSAELIVQQAHLIAAHNSHLLRNRTRR